MHFKGMAHQAADLSQQELIANLQLAVCAAGVYARTAFQGLARALGTMVRLDCLAAQNAHLPHAFAMFKRYACVLQHHLWRK